MVTVRKNAANKHTLTTSCLRFKAFTPTKLLSLGRGLSPALLVVLEALAGLCATTFIVDCGYNIKCDSMGRCIFGMVVSELQYSSLSPPHHLLYYYYYYISSHHHHHLFLLFLFSSSSFIISYLSSHFSSSDRRRLLLIPLETTTILLLTTNFVIFRIHTQQHNTQQQQRN